MEIVPQGNCKTCKRAIKDEAVYHCAGCDSKMHMRLGCIQLPQTRIDVLMELRANILLLCKDCALAGQRDVLLPSSTMRQVEDKWKSFRKKIQNETVHIIGEKLVLLKVDKSEVQKKISITYYDNFACFCIQGTPEDVSKCKSENLISMKETLINVLATLNVSTNVTNAKRLANLIQIVESLGPYLFI